MYIVKIFAEDDSLGTPLEIKPQSVEEPVDFTNRSKRKPKRAGEKGRGPIVSAETVQETFANWYRGGK